MSEEPYKLSEKKTEPIQNAYISYGFPSTTRLTQLLIKDGIKITTEEVRSVLDVQEPQQLFQPPQVRRKKDHGAITALYPFECMQIDIFSLLNFINPWRGSPYKYAFLRSIYLLEKLFALR